MTNQYLMVSESNYADSMDVSMEIVLVHKRNYGTGMVLL